MAASTRLDIRMVGCEAIGADGTNNYGPLNFDAARIFMQTTFNGKAIRMPLTGGNQTQYDGVGYVTETSQSVSFSVEAGQRLQINLYPPEGLFAKTFTCTISGQTVTLP